ncbi:MAG: beta-galactosidase, partial [Oscillospiraceae bacterium]|nr:beta-galactosidase [Candidatus Equicaccousia limihippi]
FVGQNGRQEQLGGRRHACSRHSGFIKYTEKIVEEEAKHFEDNKYIIGWQIDNEIYIQAGAGCFCDNCKKEFSKYLAAKYGTIENLNQKWCTALWSQTYQSFEDIPAPQTGWHHPQLKTEWKLFQAQGHIDFVKLQYDILKKYTDTPVGTDMMPLMGVDHEKMARFCDVSQFNHYNDVPGTRYIPFWFDYLRCFDKPFWNTETGTSWNGDTANTLGLNPDGWCKINSFLPLMYGGNANFYWLWRTHKAGHELIHGAVLQTNGKPYYMWDEVKELSAIFEKSEEFLSDTSVKNDVAMHISSYAENMAGHQKVAIEFDYFQNVMDCYQNTVRCGTPLDVITPSHSLDGYKTVITPYMLTIEEDGLCDKIVPFVQNGGRWIVGPLSDIRTLYGEKYTESYTGHIEKMCGIKFEHSIFDRNELLKLKWADGTDCKGRILFDLTTGGEAEVTVKASQVKALDNLAVVSKASCGKGEIIVVGTPLEKADFMKLIKKYCPAAFDCSENVLAVNRVGKNVKGIIAAEVEGKEGQIVLSKKYVDVISGKNYSGTVAVSPFDLLILKEI